jgi:hypothetical protein
LRVAQVVFARAAAVIAEATIRPALFDAAMQKSVHAHAAAARTQGGGKCADAFARMSVAARRDGSVSARARGSITEEITQAKNVMNAGRDAARTVAERRDSADFRSYLRCRPIRFARRQRQMPVLLSRVARHGNACAPPHAVKMKVRVTATRL